MNFITHVRMSEVLYDHLSLKMDLHQKSFIYGGIKPDITLKTVILHHTFSNYGKTLDHRAKMLKDEGLTKEQFSEGLGELCHYVCDFFCYYHAEEERFGQWIRHYLYEKRLQRVHEKMAKTEINSFLSQCLGTIDNIVDLITQKRKEYLSSPPSLTKDLAFAYSMAATVSETVIEQVIQRSRIYEQEQAYLVCPVIGGIL